MTRTILITGASRGLGRAVALHHAATEAATCWLLGRDAAALAETAEAVRARGGEAHVALVDLLDRDALAALASGLPRLDALVAAAGVSGDSPLVGDSDAAFDRILAGNLTSAWNTARAFAPCLGQGGRIVFVSSVLGRFGVPQAAAYVAAKHGLIGLTKALALELLPRGIVVNAIAPGWIDTDMARERVAELAEQMGLTPEEARRRFERDVPLGRFFTAEEVARGLAWLLDPANTTMVGQCMNLDGGVLQG